MTHDILCIGTRVVLKRSSPLHHNRAARTGTVSGWATYHVGTASPTFSARFKYLVDLDQGFYADDSKDQTWVSTLLVDPDNIEGME